MKIVALLALVGNASAFAPSISGASLSQFKTSLNQIPETSTEPQAPYYAAPPAPEGEFGAPPPPPPASPIPAVHHHGVAHGKWPHDAYASATVEEFDWINNQERNYGKLTPNVFRPYEKELDMSCGIKQGWPHGPHSHVISHEHEWENNQQRSYGHEKPNVYRPYPTELNLSGGMPKGESGPH